MKFDESRPYENEHSCRLKPPNYDRYARENCEQKHKGKCIDVIYGINKGESPEIQALRYPIKNWTASAAKNHCKTRKGTFEAAAKKKSSGEIEMKNKQIRTIKTPMLFRTMEIDRSEINEETREVNLSFSSEMPVNRYFGSEILDHSGNSVDLSFLDSGRAPLLKDHNREIQTGVVEKAYIGKDRKGRGQVRFGKSAVADAEFNDVLDGIRTNVSVGYRINKMVLEESSDENGDVYRAVDWTPLEISIVSIPADQSVGVGRNNDEREFQTEIISHGGFIMGDNEKAKQEALEKEQAEIRAKVIAEARESEIARISDIMALGKHHRYEKEALEAVKEGKTIDQFRQFILDQLGKVATPLATGGHLMPDPRIGLSNKDIAEYSFVKVIRAVALGRTDPKYTEDAAFELECHRAAKEKMEKAPQGIVVPHDVLGRQFMTPQMRQLILRTLTAGTATDGAELVADNLLAGSFIDVLRNLTVAMNLGAYVLDGLVGDVLIPRKTSGSSGGWISTEGGDAANSEAQFDQVSLTPKTVGAYSDMSRQLILQSTPAIEPLIRDDLAKAIAIAIDLASLYGSGASGQPTGVKNQTGINAPTDFAAAVPTWAEVVAMESAVAVDNALLGNLAYIIEPAMRGSLKTTAKAGTYPVFIMEKGNELNGYNCGVTSQVTSGDVFFGNWADLIIAFWGGLDITVDPYTNSLSGTIRIVALQSADVAVRHPVSFAFNNDGV